MNTYEAASCMTADCLCFRARRTARAITRLYDDALRPLGLQATQLTLLNAIAMGMARIGPTGAPMRLLADQLAMDLTTMSRNLRPLEKAGLIVVDRQEGDRRVRMVRLAPAGEVRLVEALPRWREAHAKVVTALGEEGAIRLREGFDAAARATVAAAQGR